ncbi:hypothetical protein MRX96_021267 [Rhipicephalus microplus]
MHCLLLCMALFVASITGDEISDVRVEVGLCSEDHGQWLQNEGASWPDEELATLHDALLKIAVVKASDADLESVDPYVWGTLVEVGTSIAKKGCHRICHEANQWV